MRLINTDKELIEQANKSEKAIMCNNEQYMMIIKSLKKIIKMIKADVVIDNTIDVNVLSELINDIERDNNIPTLKECEICEL
tara:strand:- start:348 stop:593 length:246 start_codon:yes stop_codon:yes gene_type:complete